MYVPGIGNAMVKFVHKIGILFLMEGSFEMWPGRGRYFLSASNARRMKEDVTGLDNYVTTRNILAHANMRT